MKLARDQKAFLADVAKNFSSVLFAGAFASELILTLNFWARVAMIAGIVFFLALGFWAVRSDEGS